MADTPDCAYAAAPTAASKAVVSVLYRGASSLAVSEFMAGRGGAPFVPADAAHLAKVTRLSRSSVYRALDDLVDVGVARLDSRTCGGEQVLGYELPLKRAIEHSPAGENTTPKKGESRPLRVSSQEITRCTPIALRIARHFRNTAAAAGIEFADLVQVATMWLLRAAQTVDLRQGTLEDYCVRWIRQGVRRHIRTGGVVTTARDADRDGHANAASYTQVDTTDRSQGGTWAVLPDGELGDHLRATAVAELHEALVCLTPRHRRLLREHYGLGTRQRKVKEIKARTRWTWARTRKELQEARDALLQVLRPLDRSASGEDGAALGPNPLPSTDGGGIAPGGPAAGAAHARSAPRKR